MSSNSVAAVVDAGDSRMNLMLKIYPEAANWQAMWALVARCNKLPRPIPKNPGQLAVGTVIALPEFDVPVYLQEDNSNSTAEVPAACGCTPSINLTAPASISNVVITNYPGLDALVAANMLVACNPSIQKSQGQLAAPQQLTGICPPKNESVAGAGLCSCGAYTTQQGDNYRKIMRNACPNCTADAATARLLLSCNIAKGVSRGQLPARLTLQLPCYEKMQEWQQRQAAGVM
jgi:hypothetical protein